MVKRRNKRIPKDKRPTLLPEAGAASSTSSRRWPLSGWLAAGAVLVLAGLLVYFSFGGHKLIPPTPSVAANVSPPTVVGVSNARYVGGKACAGCHAKEYEAWRGSHHDLAMQEANEQTVLGNFANAKFSHADNISTFFKRDGKFYVNTDGQDGKLTDYEIKYTFGVTPLQQYLIEFPGGRLQALSIAWDARPASEGGQRWFHLYPGERITHQDELHWTRHQQNWNFMCADCHSTNLKKNYDAAIGSYKSTWSEINVSCEACHGPGSRHLEWARLAGSDAGKADNKRGLEVSFQERRDVQWTADPHKGTALPQPSRPLRAELEACAPCHARRTSIAEGYSAGKSFLDYYLPPLLMPPLYHADGQQREEVYTWGSFVQSKMYHQGVTCSNCHEPHSLKLRAERNGVCAQCHTPTKYDSASHHFHKLPDAGAECVSCHMPATKYMVIDPRHDHSLRVPRPDLSVSLGVPNACNGCHRDKPAKWAADRVVQWYGHSPEGFQQFAPALKAAAERAPDAGAKLAALLENASQPEIGRATAAAAIARAPDPSGAAVVRRALGDASALVRHAALGIVEALPSEQRLQLAAPLLDDPARIVRMEAARVLAPVPSSMLAEDQRASFERAASEYEAAQKLHPDRAEHRTNIGTFYAQRGRFDKAEAELRAALDLLPAYMPAWINLADVKRIQGQNAAAEVVLRDGLKAVPGAAALHHALGLTLVRLKRTDEAVQELARAARLAPEEPRFAYVHAVALHSTGQSREGLKILEQALVRHPGDREMLVAAATFSRDLGDPAAALKYAERLAAQSPHDQGAQQLVKDLRSSTQRSR